MNPTNPNETLEALAMNAGFVAHATARQSAALREALWFTRVNQFMQLLNSTELERSFRYSGFLNGTGWQTLSMTMGIVNGQDPVKIDGRCAFPLYQPRTNFGGWVRIFRSTKAALPKNDLTVDTTVDAAFRQAQIDQDSEDWVKGIWGLSPVGPVTRDALREGILASDLFTAPWMVATWRRDFQWAVEGIAMDYLRGEAEASSPILHDLFTRPYADQVPKVDEYGDFVPGTGPSMGIQTVIRGVDTALRFGYRLDLLMDPLEEPLDAWEDGVPDLGETPLMGVVIQSNSACWLVTFGRDRDRWKIGGLAAEDTPAFLETTGVDPAQPLRERDFEQLVGLGVPVWGRIPSFAPTRE